MAASQDSVVEQLLRSECACAHNLNLTQSTQLSATQRSNERHRIRDVVLSLSSDAVLQHIAHAAASDESSRQFALCLYSLSIVLPEDKVDMMRKSRDRLQAYAQAICARFATDDTFAPHAQLVCRIACSVLAHISEDCALIIFGHVATSIQRGSATAQHMIMLLPIALAPLCCAADNAQVALLKQAKAQQAIKQLCSLHWPAQLTPAMLSKLREASLPAQLQTQLFDKAVTACEDIDPEMLASAAFETLQLSASSSQASKLGAICAMIDAHRDKAADSGPDSLQQVLSAQAQLLPQLQQQFARDKALGSAWLKDFKRATPTSATAFAVTISAAGTGSTSATALDTLKVVVLSCLKHASTLQASAWLSQLCCNPEEEMQNLASIFANVVQGSAAEQAADLANLALHLMAAGKLKVADVTQLSLATGADGIGLDWWTVNVSSLARLSLVGVALADQVVRKHSHALPSLLEQLGMSLRAADCVQAALPQLLALRICFEQHSEELKEHPQAVQDLLDGVLSAHSAMSTALLVVAWPFCAQRKALRKLVMLSLCRGQAVHNVSSRIAATQVQASMLLILHSLYDDASPGDMGNASGFSQLTQQVATQSALPLSQQPGAAADGSSLVMEFMAVLRRALAQQAPVRHVLYQGLGAIISADPTSANSVLAILYPHLQYHVDAKADAKGTVQYKLDVHKVAVEDEDGNVCIKEALPALLACSVQAAQAAAQSDNGSAGAQRMQAVWQSICQQLASSSLEDLGLQHTTNLSWKSSEGVLQQAKCYALLSLLDLCMDTESQKLLGTEDPAATRAAFGCLHDLRERLHSWLAGASRPQLLTESVVSKATAPAVAEDLALLPSDVNSRATYISSDSILLCCQCLLDEGPFQESQHEGVEDMVLSSSVLNNALGAAVSMLSHAAALRRLHNDIVASWTASESVSRAAEKLLGIADWRTLLQPLLRSCLLLLNRHTRTDDPNDETDKDTGLDISAMQCLCAVLDFAALQGCLADTLSALDSDVEEAIMAAAFQGSAAQKLASSASGASDFGKLAHLYGLLHGMIAGGADKEVEMLCTVLCSLLTKLPGPLAASVAMWPSAACGGLKKALVRPPALIATVTNSSAATGLAQLTMKASADTQDAVLAHLAFAAASEVMHANSTPPVLHVEENEKVAALATVIVGSKTAWPLSIFVLQTLATEAGSIQWLCAELEATLGQSNASPLQLQQCVSWERAAAARILLFARLLTDAADVWAQARGGATVATGGRYLDALLRACKELLKAGSALMRALLAPKGKQQGQPGKEVLAAGAAVSHDLIGKVYNVMTAAQQEQEDPNKQSKGKKAEAHAKRELARAKKDAVAMPDLVFWIESYDAACLKLSKAAKCSVIKGMKRTINRDFRINPFV